MATGNVHHKADPPPTKKLRLVNEKQKHYLLYFGSVFLWQEVEEPAFGNSIEPQEAFKKEIEKDIEVLRKDGLGTWSIAGRFKKVYTNMWLYQHSSPLNCSSLLYSFFEACSQASTESYKTFPQCSRDKHDVLMPFFCDNNGMKCYYEKELKLKPTSSRKNFIENHLSQVHAVLNNIKPTDDTPFCSPGMPNLDAVQFSKNDWSKRLAFSLVEFLPENLKSEVHYTAEDATKFSNKQSLKTGVTEVALLSFYPFKGTSDLTIKNKPVVVEGTERVPEDGSSSGEECSIEIKKQPDPLRSQIPPKVGELFAAMHISLVQKVLKLFRDKTENAKRREEVETRGLYVSSVGAHVCSMTVPVIEVIDVDNPPRDVPMKTAVFKYAPGYIDHTILCFGLTEMLQRKMHDDDDDDDEHEHI